MKKLFALLITSLPAVVFAVDTPPNDLNNPTITSPNQLLTYVKTIGNWIFSALLVVAVIMILIAAFYYLTSKGGEETKKAHKMLLYAAIAITVAVFSKGLVIVIAALAGKPIDPSTLSTPVTP